MSTKKEYTIEELQKQCEEAKKNFENLNNLIEEKKKEERELREAKLAAEKEARKKEVDDALRAYKTLLRKYMNDYEVYSYYTSSDENVFDIFNSKLWNQII